MNAKHCKKSNVLLAVLLGAALIWPVSGAAGTPAEELLTPFLDPLHTRPDRLETGVLLPGDTLAAPCGRIPSLQGLTLASAVDLALCNNPQVQSAWAAIKIQAGALGEARAAYLPTLSMSGSHVNDRTSYPGDPLFYTPTNSVGLAFSTTLNWRMFDFGERRANQRSASALLDAALASHDAQLQKTLTGVVAAYFDAQTQWASWQAKEQDEAFAAQTLATAERRQRNGAGARPDTLQTATALAKARLGKSRARGSYHKSLSALMVVLGIAPDSAPERQVTLAADVDDTTHGLQQELSAWLEQARQHPAILAAKAQVEAARQKLDATRAQGYPTIDFAGNFYQNGRPNQGLPTVRSREYVYNITVTIPLFEGFGHTYKVRGAEAVVEQKEAQLRDTEQQILGDLIKSHADAVSALENLDASGQLLASAEESVQSAQRRFEHGAADTVDILNAQAALADARQERIRCLAEWRAARLTLLANSGVLGRRGIAP